MQQVRTQTSLRAPRGACATNRMPIRNSKSGLESLLFVLALACIGAAQAGQILPTIEGQTFAGRRLVLPGGTRGRVAVLIFGFSRASKEPTGKWADKVHAEFGSRDGFDLYQLPVLEEVPRFIRGMVISSMKKGVREDVRDHFMPVLQHESELKKLVGYNQPDDAYLVVLDRTGQVVYQIHGHFTDEPYQRLRGEVEKLLGEQK